MNPLCTRQHHNIVAKRIRERFPTGSDYEMGEVPYNKIERAILSTLALDFAAWFKKDNDRFDPIKFLDACSPDTELYPLSELWEEESG